LSSTKLRIIVTGYVGSVPVGGVAWDYLQYVVGLARLGHDVTYHEETRAWPYDPVKKALSPDFGYSAQFINNFFKQYAPDLQDRWHYVHPEHESAGMSRREFDEIARTADIFLNVSGASSIPQEISPNCLKIFLDSDPGYNQIMMRNKIDQGRKVPGFIRCYDRHFTYAENIDNPDCLIPEVNVDWRPTRMPVVLDYWRSSAGRPLVADLPWTTVLTWSRFTKKLFHNGISYLGKASQMERFIGLPGLVDPQIAIAIGGAEPPISKLAANGWSILDGPEVTLTPQRYQEFIEGSRGEVSVAKHVYVAMKTGWFSCRSACYLAAGRPVVVQDTGFSNVLPVGKGVVAFNTIEEAAEGIHRVEADYSQHAKAARGLAEEWFDSDRVLSELLEEAIE
jgi:hypothetical protein